MSDAVINKGELRCLVLDDEPLAAALIAGYVRRTEGLHLVAELNSVPRALEIINSEKIDILFTDIHMPAMSGIELARRLPPGVMTVFTTAYSHHALEGFDTGAIHYLLKPVSYSRFLEAANRAMARRAAAVRYLNIKSEYRLLRLPVGDIDYVEGLKDYVKIYSGGDKRPVLTQMSMKAVEEALGVGFVRVHRSYIVNLDKVKVIERGAIEMPQGKVPIGDTYRKTLAEKLGT